MSGCRGSERVGVRSLLGSQADSQTDIFAKKVLIPNGTLTPNGTSAYEGYLGAANGPATRTHLRDPCGAGAASQSSPAAVSIMKHPEVGPVAKAAI